MINKFLFVSRLFVDALLEKNLQCEQHNAQENEFQAKYTYCGPQQTGLATSFTLFLQFLLPSGTQFIAHFFRFVRFQRFVQIVAVVVGLSTGGEHGKYPARIIGNKYWILI